LSLALAGADIIGALAKAEREGTLREKIRFFCRFALLIVDEIGYLPVIPGGGNLFFQLVNARYEKGVMILTADFRNGNMFLGTPWSPPLCLTAFFTLRPSSRSRGRAIDFASMPISRRKSPIPPTLKRRGRPPKNGALDQHDG
jgi:IstB-like ATP binding protein